MLESLNIRQFREIESLHAADLKRLNLIVGRNNSGKTTLLEAIYLLGEGTNPLSTVSLAQWRGQPTGSPTDRWRPLFHNLDAWSVITIEAMFDGIEAARRLEIQAEEQYEKTFAFGEIEESSSEGDQPTIGSIIFKYWHGDSDAPAVTKAGYATDSRRYRRQPDEGNSDQSKVSFLSARVYSKPRQDVLRFSELLRNKQEDYVINGLRTIDPRVNRVMLLSEEGGPAVYVDTGLGQLIPLAVCGEGFVRLFSIIVSLISVSNGALLIDEIDNGLHHSVLPSLWKLLDSLSLNHNVQIFATTHNDEIIRSALASFRGRPGSLGLFRIDKSGPKHRFVSYDDEEMEAVLESNFEVRG